MISVYLSIVVQGGFQHGKLKVRVNLALFPPALRTFRLAGFARSLTNTAIFLGGFPHLHCQIIRGWRVGAIRKHRQKSGLTLDLGKDKIGLKVNLLRSDKYSSEKVWTLYSDLRSCPQPFLDSKVKF